MKNLFAATLFVLSASACSLPLGPPGEWVDWTSIDGPLRPEVSPPPTERTPSAHLRIATFNLHYGNDVEALIRVLKENPRLASADVVLLQEPEERQSRALRVANALGVGYAYAPARPHKTGTHGLAILSRFPFETVEVMELPRATIAMGTERRIALAVEILVGGEPLRVVNVHLDTRLNIGDRISQLRPAIIDAPRRVIVGGDFNTNPFVWTANTIPDARTLAIADSDQARALDIYMASLDFENPTASVGSTVPLPLIRIHLDSIYTRGIAQLGDSGVERGVDVSDHWPVWLDIPVDGLQPPVNELCDARGALRPSNGESPQHRQAEEDGRLLPDS
jgi:endonuclease/exonuclease/phosphatase family metal-dependent hydrolase